MKKLLLYLMLLLSAVSFGESNEAYIKRAKRTVLNTTETFEEYVTSMLRYGELNKTNGDYIRSKNIFTVMFKSDEDLVQEATDKNFTMPKLNNIEWKVEGSGDDRIIKVSTDLVTFKVNTIVDGSFNTSRYAVFATIDRETGEYISNDDLAVAGVYMDAMIRQEYVGERILYDMLEYYPSGNVKMIAYGPGEAEFDDKSVNVRELKNELKELKKVVDEFKSKNEDEIEALSYEVNGFGDTLMVSGLYKTLTKSDKKELKKIEKEFEVIRDKAQKHWQY